MSHHILALFLLRVAFRKKKKKKKKENKPKEGCSLCNTLSMYSQSSLVFVLLYLGMPGAPL